MENNSTDHDNIVRLLERTQHILDQMQKLQDGTKKDISDLFIKVDLLEKSDIDIRNNIKQTETNSIERAAANNQRIVSLEKINQAGVTRSEDTKSYVWRKIFEWTIPFLMFLLGLVLAKAGILNLK